MLIIDRNSWHGRAYRWWYGMKYGATCYDHASNTIVPNEPPRANLCPYVRAVLLWGWLRWLLISGKAFRLPGWVPFAGGERLPVPVLGWLLLLVEVPRWAGIFSYDAKVFIHYVELGALFLAAFMGLLGLLSYWEADAALGAAMGGAFKPLCRRGASFFRLLGAYLRAGHDRVCPELAWADALAAPAVQEAPPAMAEAPAPAAAPTVPEPTAPPPVRKPRRTRKPKP